MEHQAQITNQLQIVDKSMLSENGALKYDFMTSLQNIVIAKILTKLWMNLDTEQEIVKLFQRDVKEESDFSYKWQQIEKSVSSKVLELALPNSITQKLIDIVPQIGKSIVNWINYHKKYTFNNFEKFEFSVVELICNITWTARGKIDLAQTAENILANDGSLLGDVYKFKLACAYCLEDRIFDIFPKVANPFYLNIVIDEINDPMVYFWTYKSRCSYDRASNAVNRSINEDTFDLLIQKTPINEISIKYVWNKLNEREKARNIKSLIKKLDSQDLKYSVLSSLSYEQQREIFKEFSDSILCGIFNDWLWKKYFLPTAFHILDIMSPTSFFYTLNEINVEKNSQVHNKHLYEECKYIFKQIWFGGSKCLENFILGQTIEYLLDTFVLFSLSWEHDLDIIQMILNSLTAEQKKSIIFGFHGDRHCAHLIRNDQWGLLEFFIEHTLSSEGEISQLKQRLISNKGREIAVYFLDREAFDKLEHFMSWVFETEEDMNQFRQSLAFANCNIAIKSFISCNKVDFTELENHFKWCANGDPGMINRFKAEIPTLNCAAKLFNELRKEDSFELVDEVLNWCFLNNQQQIAQFKRDMYKRGSLSYFIRSLALTLIKNDNSFKMLDKLVGWCFTTREEMHEFKTWMLYSQETGRSVCIDLLEEHRLELADKFVEWCNISSEELSIFKNALLLSDDDMRNIMLSVHEDTQDYLQLLIKWFSPSEETVQTFKALNSEICPHKFYELLDEFIESQSNLIAGDKEHNDSLDN